MIIAAKKWQDELNRLCCSLKASLGNSKDDFDDFEFERSLYYIAICLRKLNDTRLRPANFKFYQWPFEGNLYAPRGPIPSIPWWFSVDANFEMTKPVRGKQSFKDIIDMIIHSRYVDCSYNTYSIIVGSDRKDRRGSPFIFEFSCKRLLDSCAKVVNTKYSLMPPPQRSAARSQ